MWADNDPKHTSKVAQEYLVENEISNLKTPSESPDLNPIELVWGVIKKKVGLERPQTQDELDRAIRMVWNQPLTVEVCNHYIDHVIKVWPYVIKRDGAATGM